MKIRAVQTPQRAATVAVGIASDRIGDDPADREVPWDYLRRQGFTGELGQTAAWPGGDHDLVFVGIGPSAGAGADALRSAAAVAARGSRRSRVLALDLLGAVDSVDPDAGLRAQAEGAVLGAYRFTTYKSAPDDDDLSEVQLVDDRGRPGRASRRAVDEAVAVAGAVCAARDLVNEPGGVLTAPEFAQRAEAAARAGGASCTVHDEKAVTRLGLGGLLAVNRGSTVPPRFVELAYDPPKAGRSTPTVALVGKGITFDSGGLSLKTAEGMTHMKSDMGGGAAVLATVAACRDAGVPVRVRGYIPLTDNMTGGDAQRVGDVITHYGGSTTEVLNTDAEGRLVLADALTWATKARRGHRAPDAVIDLATLTGACVVALGTRTAGLFASDDSLADRITGAAGAAGERVWRLPLVEAERKALESKVADRKNVGGSRYGGAILAALYLRDFVADGVPWAHLDIAGPAYNEGADELEHPSGGTGFGVRLLLELLGSWS